MALQAALVHLQNTEVLGSNVYDHSHYCGTHKTMGDAGYVAAPDAGDADKSLGVCWSPDGLYDAHRNLGSPTVRFDAKTPSRNASRKKSRGKAKPSKKSTEKVYPEELLGDAYKDDESASSYKSAEEQIDNDALSNVDCTRFTEKNVRQSKHPPECSSCGVYDVKRGQLQSIVCKCKLKCEIEVAQCCTGKNAKPTTRLSNDQAVRSESGAFLSNDAKKTRSHLHNIRRKDQSRLIWQRRQRDGSTQGEREDQSLPDHIKFGPSTETSGFSIQQDPFAGDQVPVRSYTSAKQNFAAFGTKALDGEQELLCKGIYIGVRVDSSPDVAQHTVNSGFYPSVSKRNPIGSTQSVDMDKSDVNLTNFQRSRSNSWSTTRNHGSKSDRYQYRSVPSQTKLLQKNFSCGSMFSSKDRGAFDVIQPYVWMKLPQVKPVDDNTGSRFLDGEWRDVSYLQSNIPCRIRRGQDVNQQPSSRKWIPVCKKKVKVPNSTVSTDNRENINDNLASGKNGLHSEANLISICKTDMSNGPGSTNLVSTHEMTSHVEQAPAEIRSTNFEVNAQKLQLTKDYHQIFHVPDAFQHLFINAQMVERAFVASYRLQVASESVQLATGYQIADFERLLRSATPFITSSSSCEASDGYLRPCSPSICRDQMPNISLHAIWNWYEEPGNYGLKVDVQDTVSFHAHFVPLLSAVQLFGYQHLSSTCGNSPDSDLENHGKEAKFHPSIGEPLIPSSIKASPMGNSQVDKVNSRVINNSSDDYHGRKEPLGVAREADLIFEFFESEQPQRRMPLHNKIMELASGGTTTNQVYGDPSKLEFTNLDDLHPASWFSVAWYPIYKIPEGKFRAAFLTYHSLGYLLPRCMEKKSLDKSPVGVCLPIIGLQSYNAHGELWFSPNTEAESSFRELTSVVLRERLGKLEENALLFAKGMVTRDHVTVANRQPDYEFFMSRKH